MRDYEPDSRKRESNFHDFLKANGIDYSAFPYLSKLEELDVVANAAKHAEGKSAERLRTLRPDLFVAPSIRDSALGTFGERPVHLTLSGDDLFVQPEDLRAYLDAIEAFWRFVLEGLERARD